MPTTIEIYTGDLWTIGAMVAMALLSTWVIKKIIKLANRS